MSKILIFTITTGRSGTVFLTDFWRRNLPDARIYHEHQQWWAHGLDTPDHSDMAHFNNAGVTNKVREFWRRKFKRVLAEPGTVYAEASHYLAKAGLIENLDLLPDDVKVKIVFYKRDVKKTAMSLYNQREFENPASSWVWLHPASQNYIISPEKFRQFGRAGMIFWYVLEMRARGAYYRELLRGRPGCDYIDMNLEDLAKQETARNFVVWLTDRQPPAEVQIPPPRNRQNNVRTTELERAHFEKVYHSLHGDPEEGGKQYFLAGNRLAGTYVKEVEPVRNSSEDAENQPDSSLVNTIIVLGSWSSGTTALVGYLARLGAYTCPPHVKTNDPRTPDSYEPKAFKEKLTSFIDQHTLKPHTNDSSAFRKWMKQWLSEQKKIASSIGCTHIVLKHPLTSFFIRDLKAICDPTFIVVTRPLEAIEQSRKRRGWHPVYGNAGAKVIYNNIFNALINEQVNALEISFDRFRYDPSINTRLYNWIDINPDYSIEIAAREWVS